MLMGGVVLGIHFTPRDLNDRDLYLDGRGIELQPSAFCWQVPTKLRDPELTPILVYPIQHAPGILRQASMEPAPSTEPLSWLLSGYGCGNTRTSPERITS